MAAKAQHKYKGGTKSDGGPVRLVTRTYDAQTGATSEWEDCTPAETKKFEKAANRSRTALKASLKKK